MIHEVDELLHLVSTLCTEKRFREAIDILKDFERKSGNEYFAIWLDLIGKSDSETVKRVLTVASCTYQLENNLLPSREIMSECISSLMDLSKLDPELAYEFLWEKAIDLVNSVNLRSMLLNIYSEQVLPELIKGNITDLEGLAKQVWSAVTCLIGLSAVEKGYIREKILRTLVQAQQFTLAADYLRRCRDPIQDRWALLSIIGRKSDDLAIVQLAISDCRAFIVRVSDTEEWSEYVPALELFLEEVRKKLLTRRFELKLRPQNLVNEYVTKQLETDRSGWTPQDYESALEEYIQIEDTMGPYVDIRLMDKAKEYLQQTIGYVRHYSDEDLIPLQNIIDDLEIRQLNLLVRDRKQRGEDAVSIEREILNAFNSIGLSSERMSTCIDAVKEWTRFDWMSLEELSRKCLPTAERVLEALMGMDDADFAPFVVGYSRALENEILKKMFESFEVSLRKEISDINEFLKSELENKKVKIFAETIRRNSRDYTLRQMQRILSYAKDESQTLQRSPLMRRFRAFIDCYFEHHVFDKDYLDLLDELAEKYRNKAAHPYPVDLEAAMTFRDLLRRALNELLQAWKKPKG